MPHHETGVPVVLVNNPRGGTIAATTATASRASILREQIGGIQHPIASVRCRRRGQIELPPDLGPLGPGTAHRRGQLAPLLPLLGLHPREQVVGPGGTQPRHPGRLVLLGGLLLVHHHLLAVVSVVLLLLSTTATTLHRLADVGPDPPPISVEELALQVPSPELLLAQFQRHLLLVRGMDGGVHDEDLPHLLDAEPDAAPGTKVEVGFDGGGLARGQPAVDPGRLVGHRLGVVGPERFLGQGPRLRYQMVVLGAERGGGGEEGRAGHGDRGRLEVGVGRRRELRWRFEGAVAVVSGAFALPITTGTCTSIPCGSSDRRRLLEPPANILSDSIELRPARQFKRLGRRLFLISIIITTAGR
mmetsp:Transcript_17459/g.49960  ORF Transcript_17459/g.49960 Transcript_17459/m.49960 type:complete len:359 (+) Transcript_17459:2492-3568(+)